MEYRKLRRAVVKEELVAITGDYLTAMILNQFLYWSERVKDFDKFTLEEQLRAERHGMVIDMPLAHGWIYKKAEELSEEILTSSSIQTIRRHIARLIESGFLSERSNPLYKWDRTIQYRANLTAISEALQSKGYHLDGYSRPLTGRNISTSKMEDGVAEMEDDSSKMEEQYQRLQSETTNRKEKTESLSRNNFENYPSQSQPQSQTPTSTKVICDEAYVSVVVGKSKSDATAKRKKPQGVGGDGSSFAGNWNSSVNVPGLSSEDVAGVVSRVTTALNQAIDSTFRESDCQKHIKKCLGNGMTEAELMAVVDHVAGWLGDERQEEFLAPSFIFGSRAGEYARKSKKYGKSKASRTSGKKRQYYLVDPATNPEAVLVDEDDIPVGTDAWDKEGRRIVL